MTPQVMLDTNTASSFMRSYNGKLVDRIQSETRGLCISVVSEAELRFGVALKPDAKRLGNLVEEFLAHFQILPWTSAEAAVSGRLRAYLRKNGIGFGILDQMIAAHALATDCTLITADKAFSMIPNLKTENWEA